MLLRDIACNCLLAIAASCLSTQNWWSPGDRTLNALAAALYAIDMIGFMLPRAANKSEPSADSLAPSECRHRGHDKWPHQIQMTDDVWT